MNLKSLSNSCNNAGSSLSRTDLDGMEDVFGRTVLEKPALVFQTLYMSRLPPHRKRIQPLKSCCAPLLLAEFLLFLE